MALVRRAPPCTRRSPFQLDEVTLRPKVRNHRDVRGTCRGRSMSGINMSELRDDVELLQRLVAKLLHQSGKRDEIIAEIGMEARLAATHRPASGANPDTHLEAAFRRFEDLL